MRYKCHPCIEKEHAPSIFSSLVCDPGSRYHAHIKYLNVLLKTMKQLHCNYWTWAAEPRTGGEIIMAGGWQTLNIEIKYGANFFGAELCTQIFVGASKHPGAIFWRKHSLKPLKHAIQTCGAPQDPGQFSGKKALSAPVRCVVLGKG